MFELEEFGLPVLEGVPHHLNRTAADLNRLMIRRLFIDVRNHPKIQ